MTLPKKYSVALEKNPLWYKRGVIYEVHVRAFCDSDGDGTGDFRGLTTKLDYLRDLGVTVIWLLPFYPSPLRDDGYDISDYFNVHPHYGTLADFKLFLREAHRRGLRVVTELVLNHTSDRHAWFQRARRAKPGSRWREFYVWSNTPEKYKGARVIFKDTEASNWTWDATAGAFYWHRFYSHQPDLNFDNPAVHEEMLRALDFWLDLGVDGLRLDAVPYLYEREGTSCENLPETHAFLKKLRRHVDEKYGDRMLLAEANQWPEDAVAYFGQGRGDECHMAFHFPLMPRLFMALRMEDRVPIVDILQQTPPIPETAQWALFLRNHDELTLEMVTDEERDYMYRMYAHVQQARLNLGIRRRLAPLVGNDRKRIELLCALLFSLPGTPVIYYGDEIGMGENIFLGDRNGVRTPMQWSADKNAGFSRANPQSLYLPINLDPENHYEAVNVEVQERNLHSLLWWMKRLIALYKRCRAFGMGTMEFLHPENRKVFACVRRHEQEIILVVANLSRFVQPVELDLAAFRSLVPVELFGRTEFPAITEQPYFLTLGPHAFYWFTLEAKAPPQVESVGVPIGAGVRTLLTVEEDWEEIFGEPHHQLIEQALQGWLPSRRWFVGQGKAIKSVRVQEIVPVPIASAGGAEKEKAFLTLLRVEYVQNEPETYVLPLACAFGERADAVCRDWPPLVIARLTLNGAKRDGVLHDAIADKRFCRALLELIANRRGLPGSLGEMEATHTAILRKLRLENALDLEPSVSKSEHSNSLVHFGDRLILKLFRRLDSGINPDLEILRFLTAREFPGAPALAGALEYRVGRNEPDTVAVLSSFVPKCKDAWGFTLDSLGRFYDRVHTLPPETRQAPELPALSIVKLAAADPPASAREMIGTYLEIARALGRRTASLHLALASETEDKNFAPEPFTPHSQRALFQSIRNLVRQNFQLLGGRIETLPSEIRPHAQRLLALEPEILKRVHAVCERRLDALRIRYHGDYHLEQVLYTGKDFLVLDFEGEPEIPASERRLKRSPLRDVAGMIRSFHYAAHAALQQQIERGVLPAAQVAATAAWGRFWAWWVSAVFFKAWREAVGATPLSPSNDADLQVLMDAFLLRKAVHELGYELNRRASRVAIPLEGLLELLGQAGTH
ncbi:MAG: maltose alpha-D-glucosyltransferase [Verrucomicrobiota bacterium]|nr:maltose alpha-D-glucosyltransferase [Verrucomicrobiota bacterium]